MSRLWIAAAAGLASAAVLTVGTKAGAEPIMSPVVTVPVHPCTTICDHGPPFCSEGDHLAQDDPPYNDSVGEPHPENTCVEGICDDMHQWYGYAQCPSSDDAEASEPVDGERLRAAIARQDEAGLRDILQRSPGRAIFNAARQAVQVLSCTGQVVGHMPLPQNLANTLSTE